MKKFERFEATVPYGFKKLMVKYWMENEGSTEDEVLLYYGGVSFENLCNRIIGQTLYFIPDLGYMDEEVEGTLCFEEEDDNFVIPVNILEFDDYSEDFWREDV